ncbi:TIGR02530 family flagellar biosynthesis protein [Fusibacter bizertensis]|uniref:TIGR02530 family flagellar biosynthesis protein n=1 Tax=Fusibacter bizertensis TaxID=1488331 RepID=A0ABT6N875_9FIRM|nr:TIGR02530 family flagellar biosynthesis protein [Fusibacter bizertensis]MDH8676627.1 TIGR02530 family flagellar biosynthesis protein [Fusibacter bizertensis]
MSDFKNMNNDYMIRRSQVVSPKPVSGDSNNSKTNVTGPSFNDVLSKIKSIDHVKFSKHAMDRLSSRNIELSDDELGRINNGVDKAKTKGVREALIMMDNKVFVASVQNKTIITAALDEQLKDNVFTNIDGAVIV